MSGESQYIMDLCELCQKPIGYDSYVTDGKSQQPLHTACLDEADLQTRGFIPAGRVLREQMSKMTADLIPPDEDETKGNA
jgi:hypothetical protein